MPSQTIDIQAQATAELEEYLEQQVQSATIARTIVDFHSTKAIEVRFNNLWAGHVYPTSDGWFTDNLSIDRGYPTQAEAEDALIQALKRTLDWVDKNPVASAELKDFYSQKFAA